MSLLFLPVLFNNNIDNSFNLNCLTFAFSLVHLIYYKVFNFLNDARVKIMNHPFVKNQGGASPPPRSCLHEQ